MGPLLVIKLKPYVQIGSLHSLQVSLQFIGVVEYLLPEHHPVKFIQNGLVEPFADTVGLRVPGFGLSMLYLIQLKIKLVGMFVKTTTILRPAICHDPQYIHTTILEKGQHSII
jgi:hypothetical protein